MQHKPLVCPNCKATLEPGAAIAAGSPVHCLCCANVFRAPFAYAPASARISTAAPSSKPTPASREQRPADPGSRVPGSRVPGNHVGIPVLFGLLFIVLAGVGMVMWQTFGRRDDGSKLPEHVPLPEQAEQANDGAKLTASTQTKTSPKKAEANAPQPMHISPGDDDDDRKRREDEEKKKQLTRKTLAVNTKQPEFAPITPVDPSGLDRAKIDAAIAKGIAYLKSRQQPDGTWIDGEHVLGFVGLAGLALLECDVPPSDPAVQKAAQYVRRNLTKNQLNYDQSTAILFLDRLGEPSDRYLIQSSALRLLAKVSEVGGWDYVTNPLEATEMYQLLAFLQSSKHPNIKPLAPKANAGKPGVLPPLPNVAADDPIGQFARLQVQSPISSAQGKRPPIRREALKGSVQALPITQLQGKTKGKIVTEKVGSGDNSNAQFALLALWAARRHEVPGEQAMLAAFDRFAQNQNDDGGWPYVAGASNHTMTCAGLLVLAMGHAVSPELVVDAKGNITTKAVLDDPRIQRALKLVSSAIIMPEDKAKEIPMPNVYLLWSVERVAMLYDLKSIDGKDWYRWGAQALLHNQQARGSWESPDYIGAEPVSTTCFALLFLRRSNLTRDLTETLRLQTLIRD